jgi:hypothetical protein
VTTKQFASIFARAMELVQTHIAVDGWEVQYHGQQYVEIAHATVYLPDRQPFMLRFARICDDDLWIARVASAVHHEALNE